METGERNETSENGRPTLGSWDKIAIGVVAFLFWVFGLIVFGEWGYESQFFWASLCALAIGFAAAPFWRHRTSRWFWPAVSVVVVLNLMVLFAKRDLIALEDLPSKGVIQGLLIVDCFASWLMMVGIAAIFEGRFPWNE